MCVCGAGAGVVSSVTDESALKKRVPLRELSNREVSFWVVWSRLFLGPGKVPGKSRVEIREFFRLEGRIEKLGSTTVN